MTKAALYLRVSTSEQTTENQRRELEAVAERAGWTIAEVYEDAGISGAKSSRPALDRMMTEASRRKFDVILAWSVDRLGRSLQHLVAFLGDLHGLGVDLYLHQQGIDTTTPSGKAMFQMCGVFAEFERAMIQERIMAGLERAKAEGKRLGRPPRMDAVTKAEVQKARQNGESFRAISRRFNIPLASVQRAVKASPCNSKGE